MADDVRTSYRDTDSLNATPADIAGMVEANKASPFMELGTTGLKRAGGYIDEQFLPQLRGRKAVQIYKEMSENDPLIGSLWFTVDRLIRNVNWRVEPAGKSKEDTDNAKLVETCMDDMSHTWDDFISEVLTCIIYGWSWHEIVYKKRVGPWEKDGSKRSKYTDGMVGWRKMPIRAQETLLRWAFDDSGDVTAMVQLAPPRFETTVLPIERSLLFRYRHTKGNPEGMSMLRQAYRPWYMKKRLEEYEAVGVERDLAGLPIVKVPAEFLRAKPGSQQAQTVEAFKRMVKSVRRDEQEGIVFPMAYDQDTKQPLYSFELMGGGGARAFNTNQIIERYEQRILMSVLADFIMVGHQGGGSYSLHTDKTGIFRTSLNAIAQSIADTLNRYAIPRLFVVNGIKPSELPKIVPSDVDSPDIAQLSQFMSAMAGTGVNWFPDPTMENFVRDAARLPKLNEEEEERRRQMQMRTEATQFAQANTEYLQAKQMYTQTMMADYMGEPTQQPGQPNQQGSQQNAEQQESQQQNPQQEK